MSLLLKSELRLRVGARHCVAEVWRAGLPARCAARVTAQDEPQNPVEAALNALASQGIALPRRAVVLIEDELLYHATLPAVGGIKQGLQAAREHFGSALADQEMVVGVALMDAGRQWLATAVPADTLETWRLSLGAHDAELASAQPASLWDLQAMGAKLRLRDGLVAMLGTEGLGMVTFANNAIRDLRWERRDLTDLPGLAARLQALLAAQQAPHSVQPELLLVPHTETHAAGLQRWADTHGWRVVAPVQAPVE